MVSTLQSLVDRFTTAKRTAQEEARSKEAALQQDSKAYIEGLEQEFRKSGFIPAAQMGTMYSDIPLNWPNAVSAPRYNTGEAGYNLKLYIPNTFEGSVAAGERKSTHVNVIMVKAVPDTDGELVIEVGMKRSYASYASYYTRPKNASGYPSPGVTNISDDSNSETGRPDRIYNYEQGESFPWKQKDAAFEKVAKLLSELEWKPPAPPAKTRPSIGSILGL